MRGSIRQLILFDIADEIRLDVLREALAMPEPGRRPAFSRPAPDYVRFEKPPVVEPLECSGCEARAKYYDYGIVSIELDQQFSPEWPHLVERSAAVLADPSIEERARDLLSPRLAKAATALVSPYKSWLDEDYVIITGIPESTNDGAADLLEQHGAEIAQIVRGENRPLAESECREILDAKLSYYPNDLGGRIVRGFRVRHSCGSRAAHPAARIRKHAAAGIPPLRRTSDRRAA